jgi:hypothetical protein
MYDASNRKDIRRAEKAARANELARTEFVVAAMGTAQGRAWFYNLLESCHIFRCTFTGDAWDNFREGERNIGLVVLADINAHCVDRYMQMIKEANNARIPDPGAADLDDDPDTDDATGLDE